jgi:hypothetical protein
VRGVESADVSWRRAPIEQGSQGQGSTVRRTAVALVGYVRDRIRSAELELAAQAFREDPDDQVKRAAIGAFLDVFSQILHRSGTSVDPRTTESIRAMETALQQMQLSRETKDFIQKKLGAADVAHYARLKRALEGRQST